MSSLAFDYAARKRLESELDAIAYGPFNLGPCVNDLLHQVQHGRGRWQGWRRVLVNMLHVLGVVLSPVSALFKVRPSLPVNDVGGRFLFTSVGPLPHYREMMVRVLGRFQRDEVIVIGSPYSGANEAFAPHRFQSRMAIQRRLSWREVGHLLFLLGSALPILIQFARRYQLRVDFIVSMAAALSLAAGNVSSFRRWLLKARPSSVTTEYDRLSWTAALVLAARSLNIPTVTLQHGAIGGPCWGPLVADKILCWGQYSRQQLIDNDGVPEDRIRLVGNVLLPERRTFAQGEGLRLLVATNPVAVAVRRRRLALIAGALEPGEAVQVRVKLHPSEKITDYGELPEKLAGVEFLDHGAGTGDALVPESDLLICGNSSLALVAMHLGIPVFLLAERREELGAAQRWLDWDAARFVANSRDVRCAVEDVASGSPAIQSQVQRAAELAAKQFHAAGAVAAMLIEQQIRPRASLPQQNPDPVRQP
ncbi:MAG: hypothetical protein M0Q42_05175 [Xanthomonadales bacterium]|nr:hypothetical protein [Xanthomonadales bacterium]